VPSPLPIVAWLIATLAFLGDVPRWNDDYFFCQRDFATGERIGWVLTTREPYCRPPASCRHGARSTTCGCRRW
jgi:hypothetical protein